MSDTSWIESMPEIYDRCLGPLLFAPYADHVATLVAALEPSPRDVLELAAGTGLLTAAVVAALPDAHVVGTDLNPSMVEWAAARVPGAQWRTADATALDFPDASFDVVACQFGVMFFPDKPRAFAETARVLRPGGSFVVTTWDVAAGTPAATAFIDALSTVLPGDPPTFLARIPHGYADPSQLAADLTAGGLQVDSVEHVVLHGHADSARTVAEGYCYGTPTRFELQERGDLDELARRLGDELTATLGDGPVDTELGGYVAIARTAQS